jgi:nitric oxide reductase NorD protein
MDLDWELGLFRGLRALWRSITPEPQPDYDVAVAATLSEHAGRLSILAGLVAEHPLRVLPARGMGGVRGDELLLPPVIDLAPDPLANRGLYVLRVCVDATLFRLHASSRPQQPQPSTTPRCPSATLGAAFCAVELLREELPRFGPAWDEACLLALSARPEPSTLEGPASRDEQAIQAFLRGEVRESWPELSEQALPVPLFGRFLSSRRQSLAPDKSELPERQTGTEHEAPPADEVEVVAMPEAELELPMHAFEKVETIDPFLGRGGQMDGSDDLDDELEALEEVALSKLVRGGPPAQSLFSAEVGLDLDLPEVQRIAPGEQALLYPEWDPGKQELKPDWCAVYPTPIPMGDGSYANQARARHRRLIEHLYRDLLAFRQQRRPRPRQTQGEDVDLDAVVNAWSTLRAGRDPGQRLYRRQARHSRDVATLVLLDLSLSSDSWVEGQRVLDVSRDALLVLGEVCQRLGEPLRAIAFASHTRSQVRAFDILDWNEPWSRACRRLGTLRPQGYTRIGPALRHATAELCKVQARDRLLLLLSDGKPTDYDKYEGRYGQGDVRQAIREAHDHGIRVHALAVDSQAREALPAMMGPGRWSVLPHPDSLPLALTEAYARAAG